MSADLDILDVVAGSEGPPLQAFRSSNPFDESYQTPAQTDLDLDRDRDRDANQTPLQLLRRASETVTASILEPEKEHLLGGRPQPPPRAHGAPIPISGASEGISQKRKTAQRERGIRRPRLSVNAKWL